MKINWYGNHLGYSHQNCLALIRFRVISFWVSPDNESWCDTFIKEEKQCNKQIQVGHCVYFIYFFLPINTQKTLLWSTLNSQVKIVKLSTRKLPVVNYQLEKIGKSNVRKFEICSISSFKVFIYLLIMIHVYIKNSFKLKWFSPKIPFPCILQPSHWWLSAAGEHVLNK